MGRRLVRAPSRCLSKSIQWVHGSFVQLESFLKPWQLSIVLRAAFPPKTEHSKSQTRIEKLLNVNFVQLENTVLHWQQISLPALFLMRAQLRHGSYGRNERLVCPAECELALGLFSKPQRMAGLMELRVTTRTIAGLGRPYATSVASWEQ